MNIEHRAEILADSVAIEVFSPVRGGLPAGRGELKTGVSGRAPASRSLLGLPARTCRYDDRIPAVLSVFSAFGRKDDPADAGGRRALTRGSLCCASQKAARLG